jgi:hypothetical protein
MWYYPSICLEELRKTTTDFSISDSGPDMKPETSQIRNWSLATFSDLVLLNHTILSIPYFSPFSYCYIKYTGVLTTLIHVSPIAQGTVRLKSAMTARLLVTSARTSIWTQTGHYALSYVLEGWPSYHSQRFVQHFRSQTSALIGQCRYTMQWRVVALESTQFNSTSCCVLVIQNGCTLVPQDGRVTRMKFYTYMEMPFCTPRNVIFNIRLKIARFRSIRNAQKCIFCAVDKKM